MKANTFLLGCPRSGTTLLTEIINCNDEAAILLERHAILARDKELDVDSYDFSLANNFSQFPCEHIDINSAILRRFDQDSSDLRIYGDKIPKLYENDLFFRNANAACIPLTIVATIRNVFDICMSYNARLASQADTWSASSLDGIRDWNRFLDRLIEIRKQYPVFIFDYDNSSAMFTDFDDFLDLSCTVYTCLGLTNRLSNSGLNRLKEVHRVARNSLPLYNRERQQRRLVPLEMKAICKSANLPLYSKLTDDIAAFYELRSDI